MCAVGQQTDFHALTHRGQIARLKTLAREALARYDLGGAAVLTPLRHLENATFQGDVLETGARFCLRIHSHGHQTRETIQGEMAWLTALRDAGFVVPEPVADRSGETVLAVTVPGVPETRNVALFRWVYGRFVRRQVTPLLYERLGGFLARLHNHAATWTPPPRFVRARLDDGTMLGRTFAQSLDEAEPHFLIPAADRAALREAQARIEAAQAAVGHGPEVYGLIHADLHRGNFLIGPGGEIRAIDFDDCGFHHFLADLAVALVAVSARPDYAELQTALLTGYRRIRFLAEEHETRRLPAFLLARRFVFWRWLVARTDNPALHARVPQYVQKAVEEARAFIEAEGESRAG